MKGGKQQYDGAGEKALAATTATSGSSAPPARPPTHRDQDRAPPLPNDSKVATPYSNVATPYMDAGATADGNESGSDDEEL